MLAILKTVLAMHFEHKVAILRIKFCTLSAHGRLTALIMVTGSRPKECIPGSRPMACIFGSTPKVWIPGCRPRCVDLALG